MVYDLSRSLDRENFLRRAERLAGKGAVAELTEKGARTLAQNSYLHVILGYFAAMTGNTLAWVKQEYYKRLVNPGIFVTKRHDRFLGWVYDLRSTTELTREELTLTIERFRNWSSREADLYLPSADDRQLVAQMEAEISKNQEHL